MRLRLFLYILIIVVLNITAIGQIKTARKEISLYDYSSAILALQKCMMLKDSAILCEAAFLLAECYRMQNDPFMSKTWYGKAWELGNRDPQILFYHAQALRTMGEYLPAKTMFLKFDSLCPTVRDAVIYARCCDSAAIWSRADPDFNIRNLSNLNSPQSEFGISYYKDGILFTSDRISGEQEQYKYGWTGNSFLKLFYSTLVNDEISITGLTDPEPFDLIKEGSWHNGPASFDEKNNLCFINRTILADDKGKREGGRTRTHLLKMYSYSKLDGKWLGPDPFFLNSDEYSVGHPALSQGGDTLFFVSDMQGGFGGTDIYYCTMETGKWGNPVNPGPAVNTKGDEMFPFIDGNGNLYFASDGLPGLGGLDLFVTKYSGDQWRMPRRLGLPINSSFDDFSLATADGGKSGYFISNRPGGRGSDDIYSFRSISPAPPTRPIPTILLSGCVKEKATNQPIPESTVFLLGNENAEVRILKTNEQGYFSSFVDRHKSYVVKAMKSGWFPDCLQIRIDPGPPGDKMELPRDLLLDKLNISNRLILKDIHYDFDKWDIREDAKPSLDQVVRIMLQDPVKAELGSHTDCRGSDQYNRVLSQKRAEAAVSYIIGKGIDPSRITARGYGEEQLINGCNCMPGVICSEEDHQANRRTEFRITGITDPEFQPAFNPDSYKNGEILNAGQLPDGFFNNCLADPNR